MTSPQTVCGTWSPSPSPVHSTVTPSYPAPAHWTMSQLDNIPPPPYYPSKEEREHQSIPTHVETFAKSVFWWGFVCPLFWLAGICLIFSTLRAPSSWDEEVSYEESIHILHLIREAELRWAWRSLYAFSTLTIFTILFSLVIKFSILSG